MPRIPSRPPLDLSAKWVVVELPSMTDDYLGLTPDSHVLITSNLVACSCHVRIAPEWTLGDAVKVQTKVAGVLEREHGISHTTVQIEIEDCGKGELNCTPRSVHHDHSATDDHSH